MKKKASYSGVKKRISHQFQLGTVVLITLITLISIILTIFSLFYHNKNATNGYKLKTLREEREKILFDIEILDRQIADVSSINAEKEEGELVLSDFEKPNYKTKIIYLNKKLKERRKKEKEKEAEELKKKEEIKRIEKERELKEQHAKEQLSKEKLKQEALSLDKKKIIE